MPPTRKTWSRHGPEIEADGLPKRLRLRPRSMEPGGHLGAAVRRRSQAAERQPAPGFNLSQARDRRPARSFEHCEHGALGSNPPFRRQMTYSRQEVVRSARRRRFGSPKSHAGYLASQQISRNRATRCIVSLTYDLRDMASHTGRNRELEARRNCLIYRLLFICEGGSLPSLAGLVDDAGHAIAQPLWVRSAATSQGRRRQCFDHGQILRL